MTRPSPFQVRGVVEGFYGVYYTAPERVSMIRFIAEHGFNLYIYAPKNDRAHRNRWREPYAIKTMARFQQAVSVAGREGIDFCYALSPGVSVNYSSEEDFVKITEKLDAFFNIGVRSFALLLDDIAPDFRNESDRARFRTYAEAHVNLCNKVYDYVRGLSATCTLGMCPTDYYGSAPFTDYLYELGQGLCPDIDVFYTGPEICSGAITEKDVQDFAEAVRRAPILWDNYPVNDLAMQGEMHLGPVRGREPSIYRAARGIAAVPMIQSEASKIPLLTIADYLADPHHYDPEQSWEKALCEVAGADSAYAIRLFGENSLYSCLETVEAENLAGLVADALCVLRKGDKPSSSPDVHALEEYLVELDEACDTLKNRMDNLALRNNLLPWIEALEYWVWTGLRALEVLDQVEWKKPFYVSLGFMTEYLEAAKNHHKRMADHIIEPLAEFALATAARVEY